ncbi:GNAT family N-acetyltransferase [uncultured Formosa sp.]|uniref:GNAT family N-acetyltransferase n=1 Tax=uncultured Formosa sp. TaxID=255435 RepID=UPI00261C9616|nr:GNAT family N-acetyltransferase [uncultured Formosa sp.]
MPNKSFYISPIKLEDAKQLHEFMMANVKRFIEHLPYTLAKNLKVETSKDYIIAQQQKREHKTEYTFTIKDNTTHTIIGLILLKDIDWNNSIGEFAYCIDGDKENKGIMSSTIQQFSHYVFTTLNLERLQIVTPKSNISSTKVAINCGFIWKKTLKDEYATPNASTIDMELYELQYKR